MWPPNNHISTRSDECQHTRGNRHDSKNHRANRKRKNQHGAKPKNAIDGYCERNYRVGMEIKIRCRYDELVKLTDLKPHPKNRNNHPDSQIKRLAEIFEYQGVRHPIVVSKASGCITKGHGRLAAAIQCGMTEFPVEYQEYESEESEYADMVSDNAIALWAELDFSGINSDVPDLGPDFNIDMLGIQNFTIDVAEKGSDANDDDVPEPPAEPTTKPGDVWQLGDHRLMCGDATNVQHVEMVMAGQTPDFIYTDPPYGMNAVSKSGVLSKNYKTDIAGDNDSNTAKSAFSLIYGMWPKAKHVWWGANYYSSILPDSECWMVWNKNNGESDQTDCELAWANFRSVVRMFTQSSEKTGRVHPTQKPVSLIEWIFRRFKYDGINLFDPFGGSGSTMIACEKTNRKCFMMEIDPKYCDVVISRWENYTGRKAELTGA